MNIKLTTLLATVCVATLANGEQPNVAPVVKASKEEASGVTKQEKEIVEAKAATRGFVFSAPKPLGLSDLQELEGPSLVDFDEDGLVDILSGNYKGNLMVRKNIGTKTEPKFAARSKLKASEGDIELHHW